MGLEMSILKLAGRPDYMARDNKAKLANLKKPSQKPLEYCRDEPGHSEATVPQWLFQS